jgi:hypothetical protein
MKLATITYLVQAGAAVAVFFGLWHTFKSPSIFWPLVLGVGAYFAAGAVRAKSEGKALNTANVVK